jgi:hypothetical protein
MLGRTLKYRLTDDMKLRIEGCRAQCGQLMGQFDRRVEIDTNLKVVNIEYAVDRNCMFHSIYIIYNIFTIFIDLGIQQGFKTIKDDQLGA